MALWRSTVIVSAMTMLSRVLGLIRHCLTECLWCGKDFDTFVVAFVYRTSSVGCLLRRTSHRRLFQYWPNIKLGVPMRKFRFWLRRVFGCLMTVMTALTFIAMVAARSSAVCLRTRFPCRSREVRPRGFNVPPHHSLFIVYVVDGVCRAVSK